LVLCNAAFVGMNTKPVIGRQRDLSEIIPLLKGGEAKLVVNYEGTIKEDMRLELFGNDTIHDPNRYQPITEMEDKQKVLCHEPNTFFFGQIHSITHNDPDKVYKQQCSFNT
ncbi:hypothetical protein PFISCL1PPCAC_19156, partial [Pristionchus fissidentatus]